MSHKPDCAEMAMWALGTVIVAVISSVWAAPIEELIQITVTDDSKPNTVPFSASLAEQYQNFPEVAGVIIGDVEIVQHRNAMSNPLMKWPNGRVPYVINSLYSASVRNRISAAMREIEQDVNPPSAACVQFIPRTTEANYIEIYPGIGCYTVIGLVSRGRQGVSLGPGCEARGVILHELLHVLGFWHEQSRYDRDNFVNINVTNVEDGQEGDFETASASTMNTLNTTYDFNSIMHYGPYSHAKDKAIPVITPKAGEWNGIQMGQRRALSETDVRRIQRLYGCQEDVTHINTTENVVSCDFSNDTCDLTSNIASRLRWTTLQGSSGTGPQAGNTNGLDAYLVARETGRPGIASITTPTFNVGQVCIDFFRFQKGPSSYLRLVASGPRIARTSIVSHQGNNTQSWTHVKIGLNVPAGATVQITFEAHLNSGDVAIDDVYIYKGACR